jgi:hypothetical protein
MAVMKCNLVNKYHRLGAIRCVHFSVEYGGSRFLRNVPNDLSDCMMSRSRRKQS